LAYSRKACGADFLTAIVDGRLNIGFVDATNIYEPVGSFWRQDGSKSNAGFSYRLTRVVENDLPFRYIRKEDRYIKNMKKDTVQIIVTGIDRVQWKTTATNCFLKGAVGVLPDLLYPPSLTACVMNDKNFV